MKRLFLMEAPAGLTRQNGRPRSGRRWFANGWDIPWLGGRSTAPWVVLATVAILLAATIGTIIAFHKPNRLGYEARSFTVPDADHAVLTFSVFKAPRATAHCDIAAIDRDGVVGRLPDFPVGPAAKSSLIVQAVVPTSRAATTVQLLSCTVDRTQ
jgi:hypothetical protein